MMDSCGNLTRRSAGFVMLGDTTRVKGKVIKKYCDKGKYCVDIDVQNVLQTGGAF